MFYLAFENCIQKHFKTTIILYGYNPKKLLYFMIIILKNYVYLKNENYFEGIIFDFFQLLENKSLFTIRA